MGFEPITIIIPGALRGKGRPRFGNGRTFTDAKTQNAEAWIRHCAIEQAGQPVLENALSVEIDIDIAVPASWPRRKREQALTGAVHAMGRPDVDNCSKLVLDALNGILWRDDAQICELSVTRRYADAPQATLKVRAL